MNRGLGTFPGNVLPTVAVQLGVLCEQRSARPSDILDVFKAQTFGVHAGVMHDSFGSQTCNDRRGRRRSSKTCTCAFAVALATSLTVSAFSSALNYSKPAPFRARQLRPAPTGSSFSSQTQDLSPRSEAVQSTLRTRRGRHRWNWSVT